MRKKILVKAPMLSRSGYGEQSRFALRCLRSREDLFDIYVMNIPWGNTGHIASDDDERRWIDACMMKTMMYTEQKGHFDQSLQITVPNEFEKLAPVNIGYTAGIETTKVAPQWLQKTNETIDRLIVVSNHSKEVFENTHYDAHDQDGNEIKDYGLTVPVTAVGYPVRPTDPDPVNIELTTENNFLVVAQWGPRKNLDLTIKWFLEEHGDNENVGLILKTNSVTDSFMDREHTTTRLAQILDRFRDRKCKVYLLHGEVTAGNLTWLYQHPTMKALINIGHGEGWGLPLFEAAYNGLPLITITWSGQRDFICKPNKKGKAVPRVIRVDYDLNRVQQEAVWEGVIQADSMWAFPKEASYKRALRGALEKEGHYKQEAVALQKYITEMFVDEVQYAQFVECVYGEKVKQVLTKDLPKVSLITSVYNGDDYIRPFLEDITRQTIFEEKCELILINANSPGNEEEVINEYLEKYPDNIVYKRLDEDPGIYGVWNMAVEMSTGEFLSNANLDDRKAPNALEVHAKALFAEPDVDLVYGDMLITDKANETWESNSANGRAYNFPEFSVESLKMVNMPHAAPMWRKSIHEKHGVFNDKYKSAGDWEMWLRAATGGSIFKKLSSSPVAIYHFNPDGISTNPENFSWKRKEEEEIYETYK